MKRILIIATVQVHIASFHNPLIKMLKEKGHEVHVAGKNDLSDKNGLKIENADKIFDIPFARSPKSRDNIKAYKMLKKIIEENDYEVIHCNTPMGSVVTRLAAKKSRKKGTKVFYTAHGFHFFKGAPIINWLFYFPVEWILSFVTDKLITINTEDFEFAKKHLHAKKTEYIHGVGVNPNRYKTVDETKKSELRKQFCYDDKDFICICTGELNKNKNQSFLIEAFAKVIKANKNAKLLLAGNGENRENLEKQVKELKLENNVIFLGYVHKLEEYVQIADLVVSVSIREGLPVNIIEGMLCGKPVIASKNRGHKDLIIENSGGYLIENFNVDVLADRMITLLNDKNKCVEFGQYNLNYAQKFTIQNSITEMEKIYELQ